MLRTDGGTVSNEPTQFRDTAARIGAGLCRDAIWDGDRCNWVTPSVEDVNGRLVSVVRTCGPDVYSGTSGIALFLARLWQHTGERLFQLTAEGAISQAVSRISDVSDDVSLGILSGCPGIASTYIQLGEMFEKREWIEHGLTLIVESASRDPKGRRGIDVVTGVAGVIPCLIRMSVRYDRAALLELAGSLGNILLASARKHDYGWSWNCLNRNDDQPGCDLTGFSHGASGIAWALLELFTSTGQHVYLEGATEAIRYEQNWFSSIHQNWPDFRVEGGNELEPNGMSYPVVWCHGAPGIALTRLRAYELLRKPEYKEQAEVALRTTLIAARSSNGQDSFCLCHGIAGNADAFIFGTDVLDSVECWEVAQQIGRYGIETHVNGRRPWTSGVPGGGECPNLFLGLAGTGYFYLRLHDRRKVPSVLLPVPTTY